MTFEGFNPTKTAPWGRLQQLADKAPDMAELFAKDSERAQRYSLEVGGLYLDYSKNLVDDAILANLVELVELSPLADRRRALFHGGTINITEQRPVLHTALRATPEQLAADGLGEEAAWIAAQKARIADVSDRIRAGEWLGSTGKPVRDILCLGIGGSDLGPRMVCEALKGFAATCLRCHFVANVDGEAINSVLAGLDPETTLVIVASKTFTTQETLLNASTAAAWFGERLGLAAPLGTSHFVGVTASPENAVNFGLQRENLLEFWQWVGGRYSLWSAIGLPIAISIGYENFTRLLAGAAAMDCHFRQAPWRENMPVILALLGVWYGNFHGAQSQVVVPYCERLGLLPSYLQQLDMESNGKSVSLDGQGLTYATAPILWGQSGTNAQHSFFQLLHQGTALVPVDFIAVLRDELSSKTHHEVLLANMLAQSAALMNGDQRSELPAYRRYPGNRPSNTLLLDELNPENLGALIALYEHKVFVQGCLWHINSFDQWGVELGKTVARSLLAGDERAPLDGSTAGLLTRVKAALKTL